MENGKLILNSTAHRPWPLPRRPWIMRQTWHDLLFAHWPVPAEHLRRLVPRELPIDEFQGSAWVGVIPFWMSNVRTRFLPPFPTVHRFPELNVRTYVTINGRPGVYFFSLDAGSLLAVIGARLGFRLAYYWAKMHCTVHGDGRVEYGSHRLSRRRPADLICTYKAIRAEGRAPEQIHAERQWKQSEPGSLEFFLTERYCLYVVDSGHAIWRANIHHLRWPLQPAEAHFDVNTMAVANGIALPNIAPVKHFAKKLDVYVWLPERAI